MALMYIEFIHIYIYLYNWFNKCIIVVWYISILNCQHIVESYYVSCGAWSYCWQECDNCFLVTLTYESGPHGFDDFKRTSEPVIILGEQYSALYGKALHHNH